MAVAGNEDCAAFVVLLLTCYSLLEPAAVEMWRLTRDATLRLCDSANGPLMNGVLRKRWQWDGFIMSDCECMPSCRTTVVHLRADVWVLCGGQMMRGLTLCSLRCSPTTTRKLQRWVSTRAWTRR